MERRSSSGQARRAIQIRGGNSFPLTSQGGWQETPEKASGVSLCPNEAMADLAAMIAFWRIIRAGQEANGRIKTPVIAAYIGSRPDMRTRRGSCYKRRQTSPPLSDQLDLGEAPSSEAITRSFECVPSRTWVHREDSNPLTCRRRGRHVARARLSSA